MTEFKEAYIRDQHSMKESLDEVCEYFFVWTL